MNYNETSQWAADLGSGYSSIRPLGEGGMGTLYRAHKDSLDVDVVIKRVKQKFKGRMDERAEANILKTLKHKYGITLLFKSWLYSTFLLVRGTLHTINVNRGDCVACVISKCA